MVARGLLIAFQMTTSITINPQAESYNPAQAGKPKPPNIVNDSFIDGFAGLLDIINPLQHIPGVSTIYSQLTGDKSSPAASIIGGAIFGGPIGLIASIANAIFEQETGKDIGSHLFAAATGKYEKTSGLS